MPFLAGLVVPAAVDAAAPVGQRWSASFHHRQKLNITSATTAIRTQYSVRLQLDHGFAFGTNTRFEGRLRLATATAASGAVLGDPATRIR